MNPACRHLSQVLDVLGAAKLDLKEGGVVVDPKRPKLPEHHGGIFGRELLVAPVVVERARQHRVDLLRGELFQRTDAGLQLHPLGKFGQMALCLLGRKAPAILHDGDVELKYAM